MLQYERNNNNFLKNNRFLKEGCYQQFILDKEKMSGIEWKESSFMLLSKQYIYINIFIIP